MPSIETPEQAETCRCDTVLYRRRQLPEAQDRHGDWMTMPDTPPPPERAVYRSALAWRGPSDHPVFCQGLHRVLHNDAGFFVQKRLCCLGTPLGHVTLCANRIKWIEMGQVVREVFFESSGNSGCTIDEEETRQQLWRYTLHAVFGIVLSESDPPRQTSLEGAIIAKEPIRGKHEAFELPLSFHQSSH